MSCTHRFRLSLTAAAAAATAVAGLTALPLTGAGAAVPAPHVVARPDDVMVNTTFHVIGAGFEPSTTLVVEECSTTSWIVPQNPCAANKVTVHVTSSGSFRHAMVATLCPEVTTGAGGVVDHCFVGAPEPSGIDTVTLVGASPLVVTGP